MSNTYLIASTKQWNIDAFMQERHRFSGSWSIITSNEDLTDELLSALSPRYVFFLHWNWIVPASILSSHECVCFHMTDVPFGRGGSPLQNLIARGFETTQLSALKMTEELDAGPVYRKEELFLGGSADEIFHRSARVAIDIIDWMVENEPVPVEQVGKVTKFARRRPAQSMIPHDVGIDEVYNHIRMLDAEGYPSAFMEHGGLRFEFKNARLVDNCVDATVSIRRNLNNKDEVQ